jgi:hypothetical protein
MKQNSRVLAGANAALIGDEILQFAHAEFVGPARYRLSRLLRGQRGTEPEMKPHPQGARFVLLDPARQPRPAFPLARVGVPIAFKAAPILEGRSWPISDRRTGARSHRSVCRVLRRGGDCRPDARARRCLNDHRADRRRDQLFGRIAGEPSKFGSLLGTALGSTNIGVIGPTALYAPIPIRITANGGPFTGGKVRLVLYAMSFAAPAG